MLSWNYWRLFVALKSIPNYKTLGKYGVPKEFYKAFWEVIKGVFINSFKQSKIEGSLSISQRQAVVKLSEEKAEIKDT